MSKRKEFYINLIAFKKRVLIRMISIFTINVILLGWTVWSVPKESVLNFLAVCTLLIIAIGLFLSQNYKKQMQILKDNYLEIKDHILQWYTGNGQCTSINLKRCKKIERDRYRGFDRFVIFEDTNQHSILNLLEPEAFQTEIESITKLKTEYFSPDWKNKIIKTFGFFFPAFLAVGFTYFKYLDRNFFFLVLTVNSIFFLFQFSEKRTRGGFSESTVRRSTIILFSLLIYQIYLMTR